MSIPWRKRRDLHITPPQSGGRRVWGIKDPISLTYYEQRDEEYFVLNQLDGRCSLDDVCAAFAARFRPQTLSSQDLKQFLGQLIQQGLLVSQQPGYGRVIDDRASRSKQRLRWLGVTNLLAIRFRGFDPDRLLSSIVARCRWLFSPWLLALCGLLIAAAIVLVIVQFDELLARLPDARAWLTTKNLLIMAAVLACTKVLHELGHGLACKWFGGECHEMGFMLLVFTPCLYCNVSDIWMLNNKWKRMAVSAAGIVVEATIAACCTFLWWFSEPGLFHAICLNLMVVCSVSTLFFNGNPLLRYDGYFILSDWLEIPNLQQKGTEAVRRRLSNWYFGLNQPLPRPDAPRQELVLFGYGLASSFYRVLLTFSVLWVLYRWFSPHGLGPFVQVFAAMTLALMVALPLVTLYRWIKDPSQQAKIQWNQFWFRLILTAMVLAAVLFTPLPTRVSTTAMLEMTDAARVYVTSEGTLVDSAKPGSIVSEGQELVRLIEPRLQRELARLDGQVQEHRVRLEQLERRRVHESGVALQIPTAREALNDAEQQLIRRQQDVERLVLRAPRSGMVMPPPSQNRTHAGSLPEWSGDPMCERNRGCLLKAGTTVCLIGDRAQQEAMLVINQDQIPLVRAGQKVQLRWNESPGRVQKGEIVEVAAIDIDLLTTDLARRTQIPTRFSLSGQMKAVGTWYYAKVSLHEFPDELLPGTVGKAAIIVDSQSLFTQFRRWLGRTFAFRLR